MLIKVTIALLVASTLAIIAVAIAAFFKIRKHMTASADVHTVAADAKVSDEHANTQATR